MKKAFHKIILSMAVAISLFSFFPGVTYAATDPYVVLTPLPNTTSCTGGATTGCTTTLQQYLPNIFLLSISIAAVLAFVMITFGGITYMTSDAISGKSQGREYITNALWGLLLVIGAYVLLYTINPKILSFDLNPDHPNVQQQAPTVTAGGGSGVGGTSPAMTPAQIAAHDAVLASLNPTSAGPQIKIYNGFGACTAGQTTGCVNLNGLQQSAITGLQTIRNGCNCDILISGGTEGGHTPGSCHNSGICVDLLDSSAMRAKITNNLFASNIPACTTYNYGGGKYLYEPAGSTCGGEVASSGTHWHVQY